MPPSREDYIQSLRNTQLFRSLDEAQLNRVITRMEYGLLPAERSLFQQGEPAEYFYVVMSGRIRVTQTRGNRQHRLVDLEVGDCFGEESIKRFARRPVSISADEPAELLRMSGSDLKRFSRQFPTLKANLEISSSTQSLVQHTHLSWLNPDETVYLMARKHSYFLWEGLAGPILAALIALGLMALFYFEVLPGTVTPILLTGAIYIGSLAWGIWNYFDWSNDYNLVTNQRVVWLERVIGFYDSRQETPITTMLSVGIKTTQAGRWVGFGDVLVRTYTGTLTLHKVAHPQQIAALIEDYWTRSKETSRDAELAVIENTLRTRLDQEQIPAGVTGLNRSQSSKYYRETPYEVRPGFLQSLFANLFHLRFEEGGTVTYRKHWFILFRSIWLQTVLMIATISIAVMRAGNIITSVDPVQVYALCASAGGIFFLWFLYDYIDWHNDIYQITPEQIVDAEKKPLGKEERKVAPLENILSIEYRRLGIFGLLLNFGTVVITIGSSNFHFETVFNPSQVQQDLFHRMNNRLEAKRKVEIEAERERLSDWIMVYHRSTHPSEPPEAPEADLQQPDLF